MFILSFVFKASKIAGNSRFTRRIFSNCKKTTCDFLIFTFVKKTRDKTKRTAYKRREIYVVRLVSI